MRQILTEIGHDKQCTSTHDNKIHVLLDNSKLFVELHVRQLVFVFEVQVRQV